MKADDKLNKEMPKIFHSFIILVSIHNHIRKHHIVKEYLEIYDTNRHKLLSFYLKQALRKFSEAAQYKD